MRLLGVSMTTAPKSIVRTGAMKEYLIAAAVGLGLLYVGDAYWFHGRYFAAASRMVSEIVPSFR